MQVIKTLGDRVEKEHDQYLRDSQRIEDRSTTSNNNMQTPQLGGAVDFESLVGGGAVQPDNASASASASGTANQSWDDDVWGSIFADGSSNVRSVFIVGCAGIDPLSYRHPQRQVPSYLRLFLSLHRVHNPFPLLPKTLIQPSHRPRVRVPIPVMGAHLHRHRTTCPRKSRQSKRDLVLLSKDPHFRHQCPSYRKHQHRHIRPHRQHSIQHRTTTFH